MLFHLAFLLGEVLAADFLDFRLLAGGIGVLEGVLLIVLHEFKPLDDRIDCMMLEKREF